MFVINKKSERWGEIRSLYYLVENYREDGKIKRRTLFSLGEYKSPQEMFAFLERREATLIFILNESEKKIKNQLQKKSEVFSLDTILNIKLLKHCQIRKEEISKFL